jgi:hypothetical protein
MTTMHVGTFDTTLMRDTVSSGITIIEDRDSWEEWGEPMRQHREHPVHVILRHEHSQHLLAELASILAIEPGLLVPMAYHRQRGTLACITPDDDWSEPTLTIKDTQAERFLAYRSTGDDTDLNIWRDIEWQDYLYLRETEGA